MIEAPKAFLVSGIMMASYFATAQTTHTAVLSHTQPPALIADAGSADQSSPGKIILGGKPAASGGVAPYTYSWFPADLLNDPSSANPEINLTESLRQVFELEVQDARKCIAVSTIDVDITVTAIGKQASEFSIRPNPASKVLYIDGVSKATRIEVTTLQGVEVADAIVSGDLRQIDVSALAEGIYLVRIFTATHRETYDFRILILR